MNHFPLLSVILYLPAVVALVLLFVPRLAPTSIKYAALAATLATFVLSLIVVFSSKQTAGLRWEENHNWLPSVGIRYHLGTDGLS
ncbi:MAG: NADH-quinone oxidoreductase subunit M, partial [Thermomicrobia bacterium]|nr:NADH-quinone oxidoreductase subunit M [Thermomicrobia bacterium]